MSAVKIDIDSKELESYTKKLRQVHRSALPLAVRGTLNEAAFHMKKEEMPKSFYDKFTIRSKSFITSKSGYSKCTNTFDISKMQSEAGVKKSNNPNDSQNKLIFQEEGGVENRDFYPNDYVRKGKSNENKIYKDLYFSNFKNLRNGQPIRKPNVSLIKKDNAIFYVKSKNAKRKQGMFSRLGKKKKQVNKANRGDKSEWILLYSLKVNIDFNKKQFMQPAADKTQLKIAEFYEKNTRKRLEKLMKKK